jgi:dienelactone hydrolase
MIWVGTPGLADFRPVTSDGGGVLAFCWAHDERHLLYIQDHDGDENTHLFAADAITGRVRDLTPFDGVQASIVALTPDIPGTLLVGLNRRDPQLHDVYRLDLADGELELVEENPGFSGWIADRKLRLVAALAPGTGGGADIMVPDGPVGSWRPLYRVEHADIAAFAVCGVTDGGDLIVVSAKDARAARLIRLVPGTGEVQVLYEDAAGFDVAGVDLHPVSGQPRLVFVDRLRRDIEVLPSASEVDPALRDDLAWLRARCQGDLRLAATDGTDRRWLVIDGPDDAPASYYLYERPTGEVTFLFHHLPELAGHRLARMEPFSFAARDGLRVHGYMTFPPGADRRSLPTVIEVHGGPWTRDRWGFRALPQWLANRGYLCVQVNYRGSTGYGRDFVTAGDREWGGRMLDDVIDAAHHLVGAGYADPRRLAVYGGSFGGYAALCAAAFRPEVFCCAVSFNGASDLRSFITSVPGTWNPTIEELYRRVGHPEADAEFLWCRSPLSRVDDIRVPLLICQGANDPRVRRDQAERMVAALRARDMPHEYLLFADEGHSLAKAGNRLAFHAAVERFLARHLSGRFEPATGTELDLLRAVSA